VIIGNKVDVMELNHFPLISDNNFRQGDNFRINVINNLTNSAMLKSTSIVGHDPFCVLNFLLTI
jgi:hypothetical protein